LDQKQHYHKSICFFASLFNLIASNIMAADLCRNIEGIALAWVSACIPLKTLKECRFESFASATQRFMRCALLLVVCSGVRLAAVPLYFAKRKDASVTGGAGGQSAG
jgi:hypothetical protein